ncbi:uncharacterized protein LOC120564180 [Perca fluviatilis]|uniref:uncharacterized protein LOC120564180 n=1 Tax=Perca fluviatilis TaxID=8168 RepID=UPI001962344E|nr:uncharacterized protein LOC120564180 [Perca fluviatilis]
MMPSLSCSPGCDSCLLFSQKIVELEARISTLHQIKASEQFLDTIIIGSSPHTHTVGCLDSTVPCNTLTPPRTNTTSDPVVSPRLLPRTQPALLTSSTPHQPEPWRVSKHQSRRSGRRSAPAQPLQLENRYSILTNDEEFPSLPRPHAAHPGPSTQSTRPLRADSPPSDSSTSTLVIGSSMVRDLYIPPSPSSPSKVYCFPGANVRDIQHKLPSILARHAKVNNIIVHVGTNDIRERRSIALRKDFITLITIPDGHRKTDRHLWASTYLQEGCGEMVQTVLAPHLAGTTLHLPEHSLCRQLQLVLGNAQPPEA